MNRCCPICKTSVQQEDSFCETCGYSFKNDIHKIVGISVEPESRVRRKKLVTVFWILASLTGISTTASDCDDCCCGCDPVEQCCCC